jgi:NAD+ synthase
MARAETIARWMRQQMTTAGARGLVVRLTGGVDSAVVARLAQLAAPSAVIAALLPCHSDPADEGDAAAVASHFSLTTVRIDLSAACDQLTAGARSAMETLPATMRKSQASPDRRPIANIESRLRMTALYCLADSLNYLVAGTSSRAAIAAGHFTKYGDSGVDLVPATSAYRRKSLLARRAPDCGRDTRLKQSPASATTSLIAIWTKDRSRLHRRRR